VGVCGRALFCKLLMQGLFGGVSADLSVYCVLNVNQVLCPLKQGFCGAFVGLVS